MLESSGQLVVGPTGTAVVESSLLAHVFGARPSVSNRGTTVLVPTTLLSWGDLGVPTTALSNTGDLRVVSSVLQSCGGVDPVSLGHNSDADGSCGLGAASSAATSGRVSGPVPDADRQG